MQRIELNYGRGRLPVDLPDGVDLRVIRKRQMPVLPDPEAAVREALAAPTGAPPLAELAQRQAERLHPDLRHHPAGAERAVPADPDRAAARCRAAARAHQGAGRDRAAPAERGRRARGAGRLALGARDGRGRQPLRPRRCRARRSRHDAHARRAGQARPPPRRGRPQDRDRPGRAALHGRLVGRPQGDRARRRAQGHDHHLPQRPLHGAPAGHQLRARRQPAARGPARDRRRCWAARSRSTP